jgi:hypothetical protein
MSDCDNEVRTKKEWTQHEWRSPILWWMHLYRTGPKELCHKINNWCWNHKRPNCLSYRQITENLWSPAHRALLPASYTLSGTSSLSIRDCRLLHSDHRPLIPEENTHCTPNQQKIHLNKVANEGDGFLFWLEIYQFDLGVIVEE